MQQLYGFFCKARKFFIKFGKLIKIRQTCFHTPQVIGGGRQGKVGGPTIWGNAVSWLLNH